MSNFLTSLTFSPITTIIALPINIVCTSLKIATNIITAPVTLSIAAYEECSQNKKNKDEKEDIEDNEQELVDIELTNDARV